MTDATTTTTADTTTTTTTAAPWFTGKIDGEFLGHAQNNGWDKLEPADAAAAAIKAHREAQKLIGVPQTELLRMPKASAPTAEIDAFWQRLGAAKDAKDIDLSGIKSASGEAMNEKLAESIRSTAIASRAPKEIVTALAAAMQKHLDAEASARATDHTALVQEQQEALDRSWGKNKEANLFVAKNALMKLAQAANMPEDKAQEAWDALSKVGGIGASTALEMLRVMGVRMGEDRYVAPGGQGGGQQGVMSREQAISEIEDLKKDQAFRKRLFEGSVEDKRRWSTLHKIAFGQAA